MAALLWIGKFMCHYNSDRSNAARAGTDRCALRLLGTMATDADDLSGEQPLRGRQLNQGGIEDDFKFACHEKSGFVGHPCGHRRRITRRQLTDEASAGNHGKSVNQSGHR